MRKCCVWQFRSLFHPLWSRPYFKPIKMVCPSRLKPLKVLFNVPSRYLFTIGLFWHAIVVEVSAPLGKGLITSRQIIKNDCFTLNTGYLAFDRHYDRSSHSSPKLCYSVSMHELFESVLVWVQSPQPHSGDHTTQTFGIQVQSPIYANPRKRGMAGVEDHSQNHMHSTHRLYTTKLKDHHLLKPSHLVPCAGYYQPKPTIYTVFKASLMRNVQRQSLPMVLPDS